MPHIYDFDTIYNFRDFGGYATRDGGEVVSGKLFRSAHLNKLSDADLSDISDLGINLVVDLRYKPERTRQPSRFWEGGPDYVFDFPDANPTLKVAPHEAFIQNELHGPEDSRRHMVEGYRRRPHQDGFVKIARRTFDHLADTGDRALIHCAAGKDRTGTLCALILSVLGVEEDLIVQDFMDTMTAVDIDAMLPVAAKHMGERYGRDLEPESLRPMFGVEPAYLQAAFEAIGERDRYLADVLGVDTKKRDALRRAYLN